jgi:hypothetical protein
VNKTKAREGQTMTATHARFLTGLAIVAISSMASAAPLLRTFAGPLAGQGFGGGPGVAGTSVADYGTHQDGTGVGTAKATADAGHVGGFMQAVSLGGTLTGDTTSDYSDAFVFTGPGTSVNVSLNLGFSGSINADNRGFASINARTIINGTLVGQLFHDVFLGVTDVCTVSLFSGLPGGTCSDTYNTILTTGSITVPVGSVVFVELLLETTSAASGGGSAHVDFGNSLDFITGRDLFNLPQGFSVNSASSFVTNNRFLPNGAPRSVPEPASTALFGIALLAMMPGARRRRR